MHRYNALGLNGVVTCSADDSGAIEVPVGDDTLEYHGPTTAAAGGMLEGRICVPGRAGATWFLTLGDPPVAFEATHFSGMLGDDACMDFSVEVNWLAGTTTVLHTSNGEVVVPITEIDIEDFAG